MRMHKKMLAALLAAAVALGATGCGGGTDSSSTASSTPQVSVSIRAPEKYETEVCIGDDLIWPGMSRDAAEKILGEPVSENTIDGKISVEYSSVTLEYSVPAGTSGTEDTVFNASIINRITVNGTDEGPEVSSARGVKIGDTRSNVRTAYAQDVGYTSKGQEKDSYDIGDSGRIIFDYDEDSTVDSYTVYDTVQEGYTAVTEGMVTGVDMVPGEETEQAEPEASSDSTAAKTSGGIEDKVSVSMELVEPMEDGTMKTSVIVKNNTNETLEYAELYVVITSDSEGDLAENYYTIEDLQPWKAFTFVEYPEYASDVELYYSWDDDYQFSEPQKTSSGGTEDEAASKAYYDDLMAADYIDWSGPVTDVQYMVDGDNDWVVITFTHDIDPIAEEKLLGFESIANSATSNFFGDLFPDRAILQYEDGTIIIEKDAL